MDANRIPEPVERLMTLFNTLRADNTQILGDVYSQDLYFRDPFREIHGLDAFAAYIKRMYKHLIDVRFDFRQVLAEGDGALLSWEMTMRHKRIRRRRPLTLRGATEIRFDEKVTEHRDYFDGAALMYEHVPVLGAGIRLIRRLA